MVVRAEVSPPESISDISETGGRGAKGRDFTGTTNPSPDISEIDAGGGGERRVPTVTSNLRDL